MDARARAILIALLALLALAAAAPTSASALPPIRHVFVIWLENENANTTFGPGSQAPYLSQTLVERGAFIPNYYGVTHLSLGNYIALLSGQGSNPETQADCQVYSDFVGDPTFKSGQIMGQGCVYPASVPTLVDQLDEDQKTWKGYMEDMGNDPARDGGTTCAHPPLNQPDPTQTAAADDQYAARHNPFVYFHAIIDTPQCDRSVVPLERLRKDLITVRSTANFNFITPNLCHDGHDTTCANGEPGGLVSADEFLRLWVPRITKSPAYKRDGLLIISFDEAVSGPGGGADATACCNEPQFPNTPNNGGPTQGMGGGRTGAVALSRYIRPGTVLNPEPGQPDHVLCSAATTVLDHCYNHFSLLRTVEDLFHFPHLGYAASPNPGAFGTDIFNQH
jgi:phosphatidylinositol-3-phosphatase